MNTLTYNLDSANSLTTGQAAVVGATLGTILTVSLIIGVLLIIAGWRIFEKAGEKGWKILIPIYDAYILFKICGIKNWFWVMLCISIIAAIMMGANMPPYIEDSYGYHINYDILVDYPVYLTATAITCVSSIAFTIAIAVKLAKAFGKGVGYTLGLIFLPNIFTLILGFGKAKYDAKRLNK